jgi:succinate dehydrogenase/fumarate reductase flavoprotein subunit
LEEPGIGAEPEVAVAIATTSYQEVMGREGGEAPVMLHARLREALQSGAGIWRDRASLRTMLREIEQIADAVAVASPRDSNERCNRSAALVKNLEHLVTLASVTARAALSREESRGVHRRSDHTDRLTDEGEPTATVPFFTLARRDDHGIRIVGRSQYQLHGREHDIDGIVDPAGIDETTHARDYREDV